MTYMLGPCSVKGCSRHHGVTVTKRPASREVAQGQPRTGRRGTPERLREASEHASAVSPPGDADSFPRPVAARSGSGVLPVETPRDGRETVTGNGYDRVCAHCGIGTAGDDMDMHERRCPEYVETELAALLAKHRAVS